MEFWVEALASIDLGLVLGDWNTSFALARSFNNARTPATLLLLWQNTYGTVPPILKELAAVRGASVQPCDLALLFTRVYDTYLKLIRTGSAHATVSTTACRYVTQPMQYVHLKQPGYVATHAKLMQAESLTNEEAAAAAYLMHCTPTAGATVETPALEVIARAPDAADYLNLPQKYLGINARGQVFVLSAAQGVSELGCAHRIPHGWCTRVSSHDNEFIAADTSTAMFLTIDADMMYVFDTPLMLPASPTSSVSVFEHRYLVWNDMNDRPRAMEWNADAREVRLCSAEHARLYASSIVAVHSDANKVYRDATCVAQLPVTESIMCMYGTPIAFDAFTQAGDWWRVDVRRHCAWVVNIPGVGVLRSVAPMVDWIQ